MASVDVSAEHSTVKALTCTDSRGPTSSELNLEGITNTLKELVSALENTTEALAIICELLSEELVLKDEAGSKG